MSRQRFWLPRMTSWRRRFCICLALRGTIRSSSMAYWLAGRAKRVSALLSPRSVFCGETKVTGALGFAG